MIWVVAEGSVFGVEMLHFVSIRNLAVSLLGQQASGRAQSQEHN